MLCNIGPQMRRTIVRCPQPRLLYALISFLKGSLDCLHFTIVQCAPCGSDSLDGYKFTVKPETNTCLLSGTPHGRRLLPGGRIRQQRRIFSGVASTRFELRPRDLHATVGGMFCLLESEEACLIASISPNSQHGPWPLLSRVTTMPSKS